MTRKDSYGQRPLHPAGIDPIYERNANRIVVTGAAKERKGSIGQHSKKVDSSRQ